MTSHSALRASVFAAIEDAAAEKRQRARVRSRLRRRGLRLVECRNGWAVLDHGRTRFAGSLDEVEEWAKRLP